MWELDHKEGWGPKNWCFQTVVLEKSLQNPLDSKEIKPVNPKGNHLWKSLEGLMLKLQYFGHVMWRAHWQRPWFWERLKAKGEGDDRGWDGWMSSLTQWTWIWANFGREWTEKPGVLYSPWSHKESDILTEQQQCFQILVYFFWLSNLLAYNCSQCSHGIS